MSATITAPTGRTMRPYQSEDMGRILTEWECGRTRTALVWATGLGKGHPHNTEIPTPTGLRRFGDLAVGDQVYGVDGEPAHVTGVFERGTLPLYRVRFSDDTSVLVDGDHLWEVRDRHRRRRVVSTATLAANPLRSDDGRSWRWAIPTETAVDRPAADLPIPPYTLGAVIANGHLHGRGSPMLTTPDEQVAALVAAEAVEILDRTHPGACPRYLLPGLQTPLAALGLRVPSGEKFLPRDYVERASLDQRIALLRGLMDADGASRPGGRRSVCYFTTSPRLADDIAELVWTLGGTARVRPHERTRDGEQVIEYSINILTPTWLYPFGTGRKERDERPRRTFRPRRAIVAVEAAGEAPVRCIAVDGPRSLYLIGREHIVTHNTDGIAYTATTGIHEADDPDDWVLVLAHRRKLLDQITTRCAMYDPNISVGIVQGQAKNQIRRRIVVASEPTMRRGHRRAQLLSAHRGRRPRLVIVDECHHAAAKGYVEILKWAGCFDKDNPTPLLGVTATLVRGDTKGLGDIFQSVAAERDILFGIDNGFLVMPRGREVVGEHIDLGAVKSTAGDYAKAALGDMVEQDAGHIVAAWLEEARQPEAPSGYRTTVAFTPSVRAAEALCAEFVGAGIRAAVVTGAMSEDEQDARYAELESDKITVLCSVMVPTEGWDCLDGETEILTARGWRGMGQVAAGDMVQSLNRDTGLLEVVPVSRYVERPMRPGERMFTARSQHVDIRTSEGHEFHVRSRWSKTFETVTGADLVQRRGAYSLPLAAPSAEAPAGLHLTDDEIRFVAWFMTDGGFNGTAVEISQAKAHKDDVRALLTRLGMDFTERVRPPRAGSYPNARPLHVFTVPRGTHGGTLRRSGWDGLAQYLDKDVADILHRMTREQFLVFWEEMLKGDGDRGWLTCDRQSQVDAYTAMAITRGLSASYRVRTSASGTRWFRVAVRDKQWITSDPRDHRSARLELSTPREGERVWCVTNRNSTLITRRNGKIAIIGNCPRVSCVLNARPTKQSGLYAQMVGRGLRLWLEAVSLGHPEKVDCLVLDVVGASSRNRLVGLTELVPSAKVNRRDRELEPCVECGGYRSRDPEMIELAESEGMHRCECERIEADGDGAGSNRRRLRGPGEYGDVDLLGLRARSDLNWLRTRGGVDFLSAGKWLIGVVPDGDATFSVGYCPVWGGAVDPREVTIGELAPNRSGVTLCEGVDLDEAKAAAEWFAREHDAHGQDAPWRSARKSPSPQQINLALTLGVEHPELYTAGALSDEIDIARATKRFDG